MKLRGGVGWGVGWAVRRGVRGREALEALGARTVKPMVSVLDYFIACHQARPPLPPSACPHSRPTPDRSHTLGCARAEEAGWGVGGGAGFGTAGGGRRADGDAGVS